MTLLFCYSDYSELLAKIKTPLFIPIIANMKLIWRRSFGLKDIQVRWRYRAEAYFSIDDMVEHGKSDSWRESPGGKG
jgi:hypothetical protein